MDGAAVLAESTMSSSHGLRRVRMARTLIWTVGLACVGLLGCSTENSNANASSSAPLPSPTSLIDIPSDANVDFTERMAVPVPRSRAQLRRGVIVTLTLRNQGGDVSVEEAAPVPADASVRVSLLGFTDCASGCIGSARARPWVVAQAEKSVTTVPPFTLKSSEGSSPPLRAVLRLRAAVESPPDPCLYVSSLELTLGTGDRVRVTFAEGEWVAAILIRGETRRC